MYFVIDRFTLKPIACVTRDTAREIATNIDPLKTGRASIVEAISEEVARVRFPEAFLNMEDWEARKILHKSQHKGGKRARKINSVKRSMLNRLNRLKTNTPSSTAREIVTAREIEKRLEDELITLEHARKSPKQSHTIPILDQSFLCFTCGAQSFHDERTLTAFRMGYRTYYCLACHIEHMNSLQK